MAHANSDTSLVRMFKPAALVPALVIASSAVSLLPGVSAGTALLGGVALAQTVGNPFPEKTRAYAHSLLTWSVVGLGGSMDLAVIARVGLHGIGYTVLSISSALVLGTLLGRRLGVHRDTSLLVTAGTAICGGSAIAPVAPVIGAKHEHVSLALVTVFLLNALALFIFPAIGHRLNLSQDAFGLWCALAIHDTSSVVGAAAQYGDRALEVATAAKLARALWIVPLTFSISFLRTRAARKHAAVEAPATPRKQPWFIAGFLLVAALVTWLPALRGAGHWVSFAAHRLLALTLFLIGLGLTRSALRSLGPRPLIQAVVLWAFLASGTLFAICQHWAH